MQYQPPTSDDDDDDDTLGPQLDTAPSFDCARGSVVEIPPYDVGGLLGRGGMGEVLLAHDHRIGREVAVKRMRNRRPSESEIERFMREAQIQARLDHPAIVPVHELGNDEQGHPYFTMRRLTGTTLHALIEQGASRQRLLRAFCDVSLALEFAHARGIVHRDVKPSNIMLGDFGEVYVLDWGVAQIAGASDEDFAGSIIGTPGYAAPEQLRGEDVGPAADVYALGVVLFEILTGEPLHARDDALASTHERPTASPMARAPERAIPLELEAMCVTALAVDPARRPTARALATAIEGYLDGDRDLAQRRRRAREELAQARHVLATDPIGRRAEAMRAAGRALALDPDCPGAADLVGGLMLQPPQELPPELAERIAQSERADTSRQASSAKHALFGFFPFLPFVLWMGVEDPLAVSLVFGSVVAVIAGLWWLSRHADRRLLVIAPLLAAIVIVACSRAMSPFFVVPGLLTMVTFSLCSFPSFVERSRIVIGLMMASFAIPFLLELAGALAPTWTIGGDALSLHAHALRFEGAPALLFVLFTHLALVLVSGLHARSLAKARRDGQRALETQAWHLAQLLPQRS